jgi:hypothetical protein
MFVYAVFIFAACAEAHTEAEIQKRGEEVVEEYRTDLGHWLHLNSIDDWDLVRLIKPSLIMVVP